MKKIILSTLLLGALAFNGAIALSNAQKAPQKTLAAESDVSVEIASDGDWNPFGWGTHSVSTAGLVDTVTAGNEGNMWGSDFLDFSKHETIEVELSWDAYDNTEAAIGGNGHGLDVYIKDTANNPYGLFRIWCDSWGLDNGSHTIRLYGNNGDMWHNFVGDEGDEGSFPSEGGGYNRVILGKAKSTSSFRFRFSKERGIEFYNTWEKWSSCNNSNVINPIINGLKSNDKFTLVLGADGGFTREVKITLKTYNGQSFANDGVNFTDNVGPEILNAENLSLDQYDTFTANATAWDVFSGEREVKYYDSSDEEAGASYVLETKGENIFKAKASDANGNSSEKAMTYTVGNPTAASFAKWLMLEHSETCESKYEKAKGIFKNLSDDEKDNFVNGDYAAARARYENWCTANYDDEPYSGGDPVTSNEIRNISESSNRNNIAIAVLIASISLVSIGLCLLTLKMRKRKEN